MQIVGPRLRPVFPGVSAGISRHESLLPISRGPLFVVALQGLGVVFSFIAEECAKFVDPLAELDKTVPVVVTYFMAKMAQERAVRLVHLQPPFLALRVIGFDRVEREVVRLEHDRAVVTLGADRGRLEGEEPHAELVVGVACPRNHFEVLVGWLKILCFQRGHERAQLLLVRMILRKAAGRARGSGAGNGPNRKHRGCDENASIHSGTSDQSWMGQLEFRLKPVGTAPKTG